ncbi:MAG: hypothetical protein KME08_16700 [Aphanothece sp. CMT-3BRIN-NPC111]|jgi:tetratricopeptide (TPR) repeat protein|nr:hypothetical protein [Aphanothece sp. CMT-3BRIN-NPC111]
MLSRFPQNLRQSLVVSIVALLSVTAVGVLQVPQLNYLRNKAKSASSEALQREVDSEKVRLDLLRKLPAFGFDNLLADWVFLNFLQYFGDDEARQLTGYRLSPDYFEVIIDREPRFLDAYYYLATSASLYAGMPERSVALMEKGLKSLSPQVPPNSYYIWRQKGIDELLFLGNAQAARQSFEKAAEWASVYSDERSKQVAALSSKTAKFIARNPKSKNGQVSAWSMVLTTATDARTQKIAVERIEALGGKVFVTQEGTLKVEPPKED